jgi:hypothetical protein
MLNHKPHLLQSFFSRPLMAILGVAALLRIAYPALVLLCTHTLDVFHSRDTLSYILPAKEMLAYWTFSIEGVPDIYRTPGYSLLLLPGLLLPRMEIWIIPLQIGMGVFTVFLVHKIAELVFPDRRLVWLLASGLYAVDPLAIFYVGELSTETAFTFVLIAAVYFSVRYVLHSDTTSLIAAAILCAVSTYIRPISCYLPYLLTAFLAIRCFAGKERRLKGLFQLGLYLAVSIGLISLWQIRNKSETGYSGFSAITGVGAYYYQASAVRAKLEGRAYLDIQKELGYDEELFFTEHPMKRTEDQGRHFSRIESEANRYVLAHLSTYLPIHLGGMMRVFLDPGATGFLRVLRLDNDVDALVGVAVSGGLLHAILYFAEHRPLVFWSNMALGIFLMVYYSGAFVSLWICVPRFDFAIGFLVAVAVYFAAISGGANAVSRFRHPIAPILCLFAAHGLWACKVRWSAGRSVSGFSK